jgi:hypothetical protein
METDQQLSEGYYFCPECGKKTKHEYLKNIPAIFYESASDAELERLEKETPEPLTCTVCAADMPLEDG